jgi:hypothetical protein
LNKIGFGLLTSSVALVASTLCLHAAITQQTPTGNKGLKAVGRSFWLCNPTTPPGSSVNNLNLNLRPRIESMSELRSTERSSAVAEGRDGNYWVQNTGSEPAAFIWLPVRYFMLSRVH